MPDITVPVPDGRIAEFYQFFGQWLAGSLPYLDPQPFDDDAPDERQHWSAKDQTEAEWLWSKLSKNARAMFTVLIDAPDRKFTGEEIAETANIPNGASGVAGVLAWPGRFCLQQRRHLPTHWRAGEDDAPSVYWMTPEVADLFRTARDQAAVSAS